MLQGLSGSACAFLSRVPTDDGLLGFTDLHFPWLNAFFYHSFSAQHIVLFDGCNNTIDRVLGLSMALRRN